MQLAIIDWNEIWTPELVSSILTAGLIIAIGFPLIYGFSVLVRRLCSEFLTPHYGLFARNVILYLGCAILFIFVLLELGIDHTALLGTAGVLTIAVGFAAQTSLSNLLSGFFLLGEKPFEIGDYVCINENKGFVLSIDLLSVKLRTRDNLFIRVPNESIVKSELTNFTRFPIRRMEIKLRVARHENVQRVLDVLKDVAENNPMSLTDPAPLIVFENIGESSLEFLFGVWFERSKYFPFMTSIHKDIKERFDLEGIEIAFPHLSIYTGTKTEPMPVRLDSEAPVSS